MPGGTSKAERFLEHLEPLRGPLEGYCRRSLRNPDVIQDVLQSAIAEAYRDFHLYAQGTNFRAWIFTYVHGAIQNANRRHQRLSHEALPPDVPGKDTGFLDSDLPLHRLLLEDPDHVLEQCDTVLAETLRDLHPQERSVLLLQAIGDFKYREIAEILQVPIGTVMSSLARCRARLRERLAEYGREHGLLRPEE